MGRRTDEMAKKRIDDFEMALCWTRMGLKDSRQMMYDFVGKTETEGTESVGFPEN